MSIGEKIKQERIAKNFSFEQISEKLKIPPRCLEAIERDDISFFSSRAYYLGHLKLYLKLLDCEQLILPSQADDSSQNASLLPQMSDKISPTALQAFLCTACVIIIYLIASFYLS